MRFRSLWSMAREVIDEFSADQPFQLAAALAYYTLLSLAPMLLVIVGVAGVVFGRTAARTAILEQIRTLVGDQGASAVTAMLTHAMSGGGGIVSIIIGLVATLLGATTVFAQLRDAMNQIWNIPPRRTGNAIWQLIRQRAVSLALVVGIGFLLLVSLAASALLAALQGYLATFFPYAGVVWLALNFVISLVAIAVLIGMIFKFLPDTIVEWRDVWVGAIVTSVLFTIGKFLIGLYLGHAGIGSAYGAAGSVVILMVWVYYASLILFLGAEITQVTGHRKRARKHAHLEEKR